MQSHPSFRLLPSSAPESALRAETSGHPFWQGIPEKHGLWLVFRQKSPGGQSPPGKCASLLLQSVTTARAVLAPAFTKYAPVGSDRKFRPLVAAWFITTLPAASNTETVTSASEWSEMP